MARATIGIHMHPGFRPVSRPACWIGSLVAVLILATCLAPRAEAATVYADWLRVRRITYAANLDSYLVMFEGTPLTNETDDSGNPCGTYNEAVVKASNIGVITDSQKVDRMITQLHIALATQKKVRVFVHKCDFHGPTSFPKVYLVQVGF